MESFLLSFLSMLIALAVVLGAAWLVLRLVRTRLQPRASNGQGADDALRFVRALQLGAKERVVIVEHGGARWMLGVTAGSISTIAHWPLAAEATGHHAVDAERP
ncbi:MAG: flagellar biosynthetic protein FliO [Rubrivivax sp.]